MTRQRDATAQPQYFLTLERLMVRWQKDRDTVQSIPVTELPYTQAASGTRRTRHYLVRHLEAYERGDRNIAAPTGSSDQGKTPAEHLTTAALMARWRMIRARLLAIPFGKLPYRVSLPEQPAGEGRQTRSYLVADVEVYERAEAGREMRTVTPAAVRDKDREARIRAMRAQVPTPTYGAIGRAFGISPERVRQILFISGGDPSTKRRNAEHDAERVQQQSQRLVPDRLVEHALACDRVITALRACAARETYVPPVSPRDRFEQMVGCDAGTLQSLFGSVNKAFEAAGLPIRRVGKRWLKHRLELISRAQLNAHED